MPRSLFREILWRMAAKEIPFPQRWYDGIISTNLEVIWGTSVQKNWLRSDEKQILIKSGLVPELLGEA